MQAEHAEKVRLVEVYNQRLTEREKRRAAVIAHGLLDLKRTQVCNAFHSFFTPYSR